MKKHFLPTAFATVMILTSTIAGAQGTETRTLTVSGSYDAIVLAGTQKLNFAIGSAGEPLTAIGTPEDLDNLEITVRNNTLTIGTKRGYRSRSRTPVEIYVKNPTLKSARVSGTGSIEVTGRLDSGSNDFAVSGTGRINIESIDCSDVSCSVSGTGKVSCASVKATRLNAKVSGTGSVTLTGVTATEVEAKTSGTGSVNLSGTTSRGDYSTSGTGNIHAEDLAATEVEARSSGTGSIYCRASERFDGRASGTGKIHLYGNPGHLNFSGSERKLVQK